MLLTTWVFKIGHRVTSLKAEFVPRISQSTEFARRLPSKIVFCDATRDEDMSPFGTGIRWLTSGAAVPILGGMANDAES